MTYVTAGVAVRRRHIIKLSPDERAALARDSGVVLRRLVEFPVAGREPHFAEAYLDPGGTDLWGPGPYLKVPNGPPDGDHVPVNRVFCPWGYAGARLRVARSGVRLEIQSVELLRQDLNQWEWLIRCTAAGR